MHITLVGITPSTYPGYPLHLPLILLFTTVSRDAAISRY